MRTKPIVEKLMTRSDLASFLQVTTRTIDNLREKGLPTIMVGSSPRFDSSQVKEWLEVSGALCAAEGAAGEASL